MELLEREPFLRTLGEYAGEARQGEGRLVLVSGESGMGKTALLEAFQPRAKGTRWLWGACDGLLTPRPLGPLFDIASQAGGELAELSRGQVARDRLFTAFLSAIDSPAVPTVTVIEDVHWADEATIDLLNFAGRRLARTRALLLATYRDDELADDHPLRVVLGDLATQRATRRLRLPPLSEEAVRALAAERDMDARELYRVTGGNPFYVSEVLEAGWAYAGLGALYGGTGRIDEGLELLGKARVLGELLHEPGLVSYALNQQGVTLVGRGRDGTESIGQALGIALDADLQEAAGLAYSNLQEAASRLNMFAEAERYYADGRAYCEERELGVYSVCLQGWRAVTFALLGRWAEATDISAQVLDTKRISPVNRLNPLRVLGSIRGRRGEAGAWDLLDEALVLAEGLDEPLWIVSVRAVRAELRWISGQLDLAMAEARSGYDRGLGRVDPWLLGSVAIWLFRLQQPIGEASGLPEPLTLEMAGDGPGAAAAWERLGRTYDAALVRLGSSEEAALRQALATPAGLTAREQEVLALLSEGLPDREISRRLVISERTVHHHVSAVLAKIGVSSRTAAAREAARMGIEAST